MRQRIKLCFLLIFLSFFCGTAFSETCYLAVENAGDYNRAKVSSFSIAVVSQFIRTVQRPPRAGFNTKDCHYNLNISESKSEIAVSITGPSLNSFGESAIGGMKGVRQALLRAVYRTVPNKKSEICDLYKNYLLSDCGFESNQNSPTPTQKTYDQAAKKQSSVCDPSRGGRYSNLIRKLKIPEDAASYGSCYEWGKWNGSHYKGYGGLVPGFWVYAAPYWYIWGTIN